MKLEFLKYFVVLADELHFARAAQKVAITQPALSAAIKSLEADIGVQLFARNRSRVQLTPAGAAFQSEAHQFLEGYSRAKILAQAVSAGLTGRLEIGFGVTLIYRDLLEIIKEFNKEAPGIDIVLREMSMAAQFEGLLRGRIHAGFSVGSTVPPELTRTALKDDQFSLCVPTAHPAAQLREADLADFADESFIMVCRESGPSSYDDVMGLFDRANFHPKLAHQTMSWISVMSMVAHGCGLGLVPSSLARLKASGVSIIPLAGPPAAVSAMMMWNPQHVSPALANFLETAARIIQRQKGRLPHHEA